MSSQPKPGRPPKPANERAGSYLHIRLPDGKKAGYVKASQLDNKKLSEWVICNLDKALLQSFKRAEDSRK